MLLRSLLQHSRSVLHSWYDMLTDACGVALRSYGRLAVHGWVHTACTTGSAGWTCIVGKALNLRCGCMCGCRVLLSLYCQPDECTSHVTSHCSANSVCASIATPHYSMQLQLAIKQQGASAAAVHTRAWFVDKQVFCCGIFVLLQETFTAYR